MITAKRFTKFALPTSAPIGGITRSSTSDLTAELNAPENNQNKKVRVIFPFLPPTFGPFFQQHLVLNLTHSPINAHDNWTKFPFTRNSQKLRMGDNAPRKTFFVRVGCCCCCWWGRAMRRGSLSWTFCISCMKPVLRWEKNSFDFSLVRHMSPLSFLFFDLRNQLTNRTLLVFQNFNALFHSNTDTELELEVRWFQAAQQRPNRKWRPACRQIERQDATNEIDRHLAEFVESWSS